MTFRIVQWATGAMGRACLRGALDRRGLEVVGAFVYSESKVGQDVGALVRRPPIGVTATDSIDEILALDADVVIHAARLQESYDGHDDDIVRLLESGKNVVSLNGNTYPSHWRPERRSRLEQACQKGGVSFMGAGLNPGFAAEQLAVVASGVCLDVSHVIISEVVMCNLMRSPDYVFSLLGFGSTPGAIDPNGDQWAPASTLNDMFEEVVASLCGRLGFPITGVDHNHRMLPTDVDLEVGAGLIRAGTVSHLDWCWRGMVGASAACELRIAWAMDRTHVHRRGEETWRVQIDGTPSVDLSFELGLPAGLEGRTSVEQLGVAGAVLNAIPYLAEASPGVLESPSSAPWRYVAQ